MSFNLKPFCNVCSRLFSSSLCEVTVTGIMMNSAYRWVDLANQTGVSASFCSCLRKWTVQNKVKQKRCKRNKHQTTSRRWETSIFLLLLSIILLYSVHYLFYLDDRGPNLFGYTGPFCCLVKADTGRESKGGSITPADRTKLQSCLQISPVT